MMIHDATLDDLKRIGSALCASDRMELAATRDPDDVEKLAADAYASSMKKVALDGDAPVFAFGAGVLPGDVAVVWGFKTERGWAAVRAVTKFIRRTMIPDLRAIGVRRAVCLVHPDNDRSREWLAHLGFKPRATLQGFGTRREGMLLYQRDEPRERP